MNSAQTPTPEQAAQAKSLVLLFVKAFGAFFMISAVIVGFDMFGAAQVLGFDSTSAKIFGGVLFAMGIADFIFIPKMLEKAMFPQKPLQ